MLPRWMRCCLSLLGKVLRRRFRRVVVLALLAAGLWAAYLELWAPTDGGEHPSLNHRYGSWSELVKAQRKQDSPSLQFQLSKKPEVQKQAYRRGQSDITTLKNNSSSRHEVQKQAYRREQSNITALKRSSSSRHKFNGRVNLHVFEDWCGGSIEQLRKSNHFPLHPHTRTTLKKLASSPSWKNYGLRIFGYLHPPADGEFQFAIAADDNAEFWLSQSEKISDLHLVARVGKSGKEWTAPGEYEKFRSQKSKPVRLSLMKKYYFEVLHKQDDKGTGHVEVAWKKNVLETEFSIIGSQFLSLYCNESLLKMDEVAHIPQTAATRKILVRNTTAYPADILEPDPRDTMYKLPLMSKRKVHNILPLCPYKPSYLVNGLKLERYQGLQFVHLSYVYPNDYTRLTYMETSNKCFYQQHPAYLNRFGFSKFLKMDPLESQNYEETTELPGNEENHFDDAQYADPEIEDTIPPLNSTRLKIDSLQAAENISNYNYSPQKPQNLLSVPRKDIQNKEAIRQKMTLVSESKINPGANSRMKKLHLKDRVTENLRNSPSNDRSVHRLPATKWKAENAGLDTNKRFEMAGEQNLKRHRDSGGGIFQESRITPLEFDTKRNKNTSVDTKKTRRQFQALDEKPGKANLSEHPIHEDQWFNQVDSYIAQHKAADTANVILGGIDLDPQRPVGIDSAQPTVQEGEEDETQAMMVEEDERAEEDFEDMPVIKKSVNWKNTFSVNNLDFQLLRSDWINLNCNTSGNLLLNEKEALQIVHAFLRKLDQMDTGRFKLRRILNVEKRKDKLKGSRYLLELELLEHGRHLIRFSEYVFAEDWHGFDNREKQWMMQVEAWGYRRHLMANADEPVLCWPFGFSWNHRAVVHFIVPVKNQARWVIQFISDMEMLLKQTKDPSFSVIITDYSSDDMDVEMALKRSSLPRYQYLRLTGNFQRSAGLQAGVDLVKDPHSIIFLCDLHIHFPVGIIDSIRKHCVEGKLAFAPIVVRLNCGASPQEPEGYWEVNGFGLLSIYKSDLIRIGGMNTKEFREKWGGEDWELLDRIMEAGLEVDRLSLRNFFHYFHSKRGMWDRH